LQNGEEKLNNFEFKGKEIEFCLQNFSEQKDGRVTHVCNPKTEIKEGRSQV
jgi:hypothetical protein